MVLLVSSPASTVPGNSEALRPKIITNKNRILVFMAAPSFRAGVQGFGSLSRKRDANAELDRCRKLVVAYAICCGL
jgi:hypothetical protein